MSELTEKAETKKIDYSLLTGDELYRIMGVNYDFGEISYNLYEIGHFSDYDYRVVTNNSQNIRNKDDFYFKVYNNSMLHDATKVARIYLGRCAYVPHPANDSKESWILSWREKRELNKYLNSKIEITLNGWHDEKVTVEMTVYQRIILAINCDEFGIKEIETFFRMNKEGLSVTMKKPDYTKL